MCVLVCLDVAVPPIPLHHLPVAQLAAEDVEGAANRQPHLFMNDTPYT